MIPSPTVAQDPIAIDIPSVFSSAAAFVQSHVENANQCSFLLAALGHLQAEASREPCISFIHLPLLVSAAIRGEARFAYPLAVTTTLLFLGFDILDDLADGDRRPFWEGRPPEEIRLAAMLLLCCLPQLSIAGLAIPPKRKDLLHRVLAESLARMANGQQRDLAMTRSNGATVEEVERSVVGKSGEEMALFAVLAAHHAGATKRNAEACAAFARSLGTAAQLATDCHDLFEASLSRDLSHGARTLPIAFHLERAKGEEREAFLRMLSDAEGDLRCHEAVRARLKAAGDLRRTALVIELYCQRALNALDRARPQEQARGALQHLIRSASLFHPNTKGGTDELREYRKAGGPVAGGCDLPARFEKGPGGDHPPVQHHAEHGRGLDAQGNRLEPAR